MNPLFEYFVQNWNQDPYPVIDHSLRIQKQEDGSFHFYIHPSHQGGVTTDIVVGPNFTVLRENQ
jgi:hypothetical protein